MYQFTFNFDNGTLLNISPNSVLVFLDETGDEQLNDPAYPIFGFGGCCILARDYFDNIDKPWSNMKIENFDLIHKALHASENHYTYKQMTALNSFFSSNTFGRFAAISSKSTRIDAALQLEQIVYYSLYKRIVDIIKWYELDNIVIIYEDSVRLKPKLEKYTTGINFLEKINDINVKINIHYCTMNKKHTFSGLEVADFIIHSAGTALRDRINGKIRNLTDREDFDNIFKNTDSKYSSPSDTTLKISFT